MVESTLCIDVMAKTESYRTRVIEECPLMKFTGGFEKFVLLTRMMLSDGRKTSFAEPSNECKTREVEVTTDSVPNCVLLSVPPVGF